MNNFTCHLCKEQYEKDREDWSEEEAKEEYNRNFPEFKNANDLVLLCDDCL